MVGSTTGSAPKPKKKKNGICAGRAPRSKRQRALTRTLTTSSPRAQDSNKASATTSLHLWRIYQTRHQKIGQKVTSKLQAFRLFMATSRQEPPTLTSMKRRTRLPTLLWLSLKMSRLHQSTRIPFLPQLSSTRPSPTLMLQACRNWRMSWAAPKCPLRNG